MSGASAGAVPPALLAAPLAPSPAFLAIEALPVPLQEEIFFLLGLHDTARAAAVCRHWAQLAQRILETRLEINAAADLPLLSRQHNLLLLGGGSGIISGDGGGGLAPSDRSHRRLLGYLPAAVHYASQHCRALHRLHLELAPPQVPLAAAADAVARAVAGEPWQAAPQPLAALAAAATDVGCPPVDGYIIKLLAQSCPDLRSLRLVNVTNSAATNRLLRLNDSCLAILARSCPLLEELVLGHRGGEECVFNPASSFYLEDITDAGLRALAHGGSRLRRLGLLRCSRVGDEGLAAVAQMCRQLTSLLLHDCPGVSDRALMEVGEHCTQLRALDCTVARRSSGLLMMGEEGEQLGFRALFTIAANCPLLEDVSISEEGLEAPVVDDDCLIVLAQGCPRLRRLSLRHCSAVSDVGARAVASRCKLLQELVLEHTAVGDAGVAALARGLPCLRTLCLSNYISSLAHLAFLPGAYQRQPRGVTDAALLHVAQHCTALHHLAVTGSRRVTDAGLLHLAHRPAAVAAAAAVALLPGADGGCSEVAVPQLPVGFHRQLTSLTINHTAATDGAVCELLQRCGQLRCLSLRGLLYNADATVARVAASCRHLTSLDLRHCSTLSDAGLGEVARLRFLRSLHLSFCVRITDAGLLLLAAAGCAPGAHSGAGTDGGHRPCASLYRSSTGPLWSAGAGGAASRAAHRSASSGAAEDCAAWGAAGAPTGSESSAAAAGGALHDGTRYRSLLQEIELYHVPQVTHRGIRTLVEACPGMTHINIGKCRLVRVESLRALLCGRGVRLSSCHYLDTA